MKKSCDKKRFNCSLNSVNKKAQLTLLIILGIVVVILILGYTLFSGVYKDSFLKNDKAKTLKDNLMNCFEGTLLYSVEVVSLKGGYYEKTTDPFYEEGNAFLAYYYFEGEEYVPELNTIEAELQKSAKESMKACLDYYVNDTNYDLSYNDYFVDAKINEEDITFFVNLELTVSFENKTGIFDFNKDPIVIRSDLKKMHEVSSTFVKGFLDNSEEWIDLTELVETGKENNFIINITEIKIPENTYIYTITKNQTEISPEQFQFAVKLNLKELTVPDSL